MPNASANQNSTNRSYRFWLLLFLRLLGGGILGYIVSFLLFRLTVYGYLSLFGLVIIGQEQLFDLAFFYALYDKLGSTNLTSNMALFVYASLWAFIGALLMSGRRKQIRLGVIFLILYVIAGFLSYTFFTLLMIPT